MCALLCVTLKLMNTSVLYIVSALSKWQERGSLWPRSGPHSQSDPARRGFMPVMCLIHSNVTGPHLACHINCATIARSRPHPVHLPFAMPEVGQKCRLDARSVQDPSSMWVVACTWYKRYSDYNSTAIRLDRTKWEKNKKQKLYSEQQIAVSERVDWYFNWTW